MTTTGTAPRILAHFIDGGWDLRHEGCAAKCCEAKAEAIPSSQTWSPAGRFYGWACDGCGAELARDPAPIDFDRTETCESCADGTATP